MREISGNARPAAHDRFAIVCARFNAPLTDSLLAGCLAYFKKAGVADRRLTLVRVPGAFEIPATAKRLAETGAYAAVLCLGAVVRGATPHFDYVAGECARGIAEVSRACNLPVIFGVITTDTWAQAEERAQPGLIDNKGADAAQAAIEMAGVFAGIDAAAETDAQADIEAGIQAANRVARALKHRPKTPVSRAPARTAKAPRK